MISVGTRGRRRIPNLVRRAIARVVLTTVVACAGESTAPADQTGVYVLTAIDGRAMPTWFLNQPPLRVDMLSGEFTLMKDGTATATNTSRTFDGVNTTTSVSNGTGTYTIIGGTLTFDLHGPNWSKTTRGAIRGSVVQMDDVGQGVFTYQRR